jgi:hypothetical protein
VIAVALKGMQEGLEPVTSAVRLAEGRLVRL